jgi:pyruvate dehydrogenase E2 component (dihydrolipoamide acetyltransferase)
MSIGQVEPLDYAERWLHDGLSVIASPGGFLSVEVDMSNAVSLRQRMKDNGTPVTYTHLIVQATAKALSDHPELHVLIAGYKRLNPENVDICLSVAGESAVTPVLLIKNAGNKSLMEIASEVRDGAAKVQQEDKKLHDALRRWGWLLPTGFLRRGLLRFLLKRISYCSRVSGTFQVTLVPSVDYFVPFLFNTAAVLAGGKVRDRVISVDGQIVSRPILSLTCCHSHKIWNGMNTALFLNAVKNHLERETA